MLAALCSVVQGSREVQGAAGVPLWLRYRRAAGGRCTGWHVVGMMLCVCSKARVRDVGSTAVEAGVCGEWMWEGGRAREVVDTGQYSRKWWA